MGGENPEPKDTTAAVDVGWMNALKVTARVCCLAVFFAFALGHRSTGTGAEQRCLHSSQRCERKKRARPGEGEGERGREKEREKPIPSADDLRKVRKRVCASTGNS